MKRLSLLISVGIFFSVCAVQSSLGDDLKNIKGMWVWDMGQLLINDTAKQTDLFQYCKAPHGDTSFPINRLFFEARTYNKNYHPYRLISDPLTNFDASKLRTFLSKAHAQGLKVEYLDGQALWVKNAYKFDPKNICGKVIAFNAKSQVVEERFDGIHFDIEPHTLGASWRTNTSRGRDKYNDEYEDNFLEILRDCRNQIQQSGQTVTLSVDLGTDYSYYVTDLWDGLARERTADYITIMNYFNNLYEYLNGTNGIGGVINNLRLAQNLPLVFGAETMPDTLVPPNITFWSKGFASLKSVLTSVIQQYNTEPLFNGISVHHYYSFYSMKDGDNTPPDSKPTCIKNNATGNLTASGLSTNINCVMRTDTYDEKAPINGSVTFTNAANVTAVELYTQLNGPKDCSGFVGSLSCVSMS